MTERVALRLLADGTAMLALRDGDGDVRANFLVNAEGSHTAVQLFDESGGAARESLSLSNPR